MHTQQAIIAFALAGTSALAWIASAQQHHTTMSAMSADSPVAISLFVATWTIGMAAMMFPGISRLVLAYNNLTRNSGSSRVVVELAPDTSPHSAKLVLFIGSYLALWAAAGLALYLTWTVLLSSALVSAGGAVMAVFNGAVLLIAGIYQFSPLKTECLKACAEPNHFFMRYWQGSTHGTVVMGLNHGAQCLGTCWPYFVIMVALGWNSLAWMALFAGVIFVEKIWSRGIWVSRAGGIALVVAGILSMTGIISL